MSVCAVVAGADDFVAIADFARMRKDWFARFLDVSAGVPSHDRFNAIYILNVQLSGERFAEAVRGHWGIENNLHWQLDVTFGEDECRIRKGHGDENFSTLRRTALSLLKKEKTLKAGVKNRRLKASWDNAYLEKVIFNQ